MKALSILPFYYFIRLFQPGLQLNVPRDGTIQKEHTMPYVPYHQKSAERRRQRFTFACFAKLRYHHRLLIRCFDLFFDDFLFLMLDSR